MKTIHCMLTTECNLKCQYCFYCQWDDRKTVNRMTLDTFEKVLTSAKELECNEIAFTGGEPLLHKNLIEFAKLAQKEGISTSITTNAKLLNEEKIDQLVNAGVQKFALSLDSLRPEIHESIRRNSKLDEIIDATMILKKYSGIHINYITVVTSKNHSTIGELLLFATKNNINIVFQPIIYDSSYSGCRDLYEFDFASKEWEAFSQVIDVWGKHSKEESYVRAMKTYLQHKPLQVERCEHNGDIAVIYPNGNVHPCFMQYKNEIGNINTDSLETILMNYNNFKKCEIDRGTCFKDECITMLYSWEG